MNLLQNCLVIRAPKLVIRTLLVSLRFRLTILWDRLSTMVRILLKALVVNIRISLLWIVTCCSTYRTKVIRKIRRRMKNLGRKLTIRLRPFRNRTWITITLLLFLLLFTSISTNSSGLRWLFLILLGTRVLSMKLTKLLIRETNSLRFRPTKRLTRILLTRKKVGRVTLLIVIILIRRRVTGMTLKGSRENTEMCERNEGVGNTRRCEAVGFYKHAKETVRDTSD